MNLTRYPLCWPDNVARTAPHNRAYPLFYERTVAVAVDQVLAEINRINDRDWRYADEDVIVSTNLRSTLAGRPMSNGAEPPDTGVAVYFQLRFARNGKWFKRPVVMTCDRWLKVNLNLTAIAKDIEAQRARLRWGTTTVEQAFQGYVAIPEKCGGFSWWERLGVRSDSGRDEIKEAYRVKAMIGHPDKGGDPEEWHKIQLAYDQAMGA